MFDLRGTQYRNSLHMHQCTMFFITILLSSLIHVVYSCRPNPALGSIPSSWEDVNAVVPFRTHGVEGTFILLKHGASLLRLPDNLSDLGDSFTPEFAAKLGFPEEHGICMAIPDIFTRGNLIRLKTDLTSHFVFDEQQNFGGDVIRNVMNISMADHLPQNQDGTNNFGIGKAATATGTQKSDTTNTNTSSSNPDGGSFNKNSNGFNRIVATVMAEQVKKNSDLLKTKKSHIEKHLNPLGRYCNELVTDLDFWNPEFLSTFELQQRWRNYLHELTGILLILGPQAPSDEQMFQIIPTPGTPMSYPHPDGTRMIETQFFAAAHYVRGHSWHDERDSVLQTITNTMSEQPGVQLVLVLGVPNTSFTTMLGLELHCTVPVVDGGNFNIFPDKQQYIQRTWMQDEIRNIEQQQLSNTTTSNSNANRKAVSEVLGESGNHVTWRLLTRNYEGLTLPKKQQQSEKLHPSAGFSFNRKPADDYANAVADALTFDLSKSQEGKFRQSVEFVINHDQNSMQTAIERQQPINIISDGQTKKIVQKVTEHKYAPEWTRKYDNEDHYFFQDLTNCDWELFVQPTAPGGHRLPTRKRADEDTEIDSDNIIPLGRVRIPYAPQSSLSGLQTKISAEEKLYFKLSEMVMLPKIQSQIVDQSQIQTYTYRLTIDACDWRCEIFSNGRLIFQHQGGYDAFGVDLYTEDMTDYNSTHLGFELLITAWDPTDEQCEFVQTPPVPCIECCKIATQPRGKQSLNPGFIMYSPVTGLWKNGIWIDKVPLCRIEDYSTSYDYKTQEVTVFGIVLTAGCFDERRGLITGRTDTGGDQLNVLIKFDIWEESDNDHDSVQQYSDIDSQKDEKKAVNTQETVGSMFSSWWSGSGSVPRSTSETNLTDASLVITQTLRLIEDPRKEYNSHMDVQKNKLKFKMPMNIKEWSINQPYLYRSRISLLHPKTTASDSPGQNSDDETTKKLDTVAASSLSDDASLLDSIYRPLGLRTISMQKNQIYLNSEHIFLHGVLHQGYWPESLITPVNEEAVWQEVRAMKQAGFNTVRVHMSVFPSIFYYACDRIGLLVIQDMPSGDGRVIPAWDMHRKGKQQDMDDNIGFDEIVRSKESKQNFLMELKSMITAMKMFCSVIIWTLFNEGWGQSNTLETILFTRHWDPTRLVNAVSGWNDPVLFGEPHPAIYFEEYRLEQNRTLFNADVGDFFDVHNYEGSPFQNLSKTFEMYPFPLANRPILVGEYGGIGYSLSERHEYDADASWGYGNVKQSNSGFREALAAVFDRVRILFCYKQWEGKQRDNINGPKDTADNPDPTAGHYREISEKQDRNSPNGYNKYNVVGAIYTQWTDVETEINGLMTYDRVPKIPLDELNLLGQKLIQDYHTCAKSRV